jgi:hypothetical protein
VDSKTKAIDSFQIIGFAVSTCVAIALVAFNVDPMQSTILGLILATLTQLFDLQLRHSNSEDRLLAASALSQSLYRDPALLSRVRQIVDDYYSVMNGWFELFKMRGEDALSECQRVLHSMANGTMESAPSSQFSLSVHGLKLAQKSLRQATDFSAIRDTVEGVRGWYARSWADAASRGVDMKMVLIMSRDDLKELAFQAQTVTTPEGTHIAFAEDLPPGLDENFLVVDDRVVSYSERRADKTLGERTVSVVPIEVERMVKRFDQLMRYARRAEDVLDAAIKAMPRDDLPPAK